MRKDGGLFAGAAVALAAAAPLAALLPAGTLAGLGDWLRELSLSGPGGNAGAWGIALGLSALPALGLLLRGRRRAGCCCWRRGRFWRGCSTWSIPRC